MSKSSGGTRSSSATSPRGLTANDAFRMLENGGNGREILNQIRRERNDPSLDWEALDAERYEGQTSERITTVSEFIKQQADSAYREISESLTKPRGSSDEAWQDTLSAMRQEIDSFAQFTSGRITSNPVAQWRDNPNSGQFYGTALSHYTVATAERLERLFERGLRKIF